MVDFGESEKMIRISGKMNNSNTYNGFSCNNSFFFFQGRKIVIYKSNNEKRLQILEAICIK